MYYTDKQLLKNRAMAPSRIFIGGLHKAIIADDLEAKFSKHGKILVLIVKSGCAVLQYEYENEAHTAIRMENGSNMMGRKIIVFQPYYKKDISGGPQIQSEGPMPKMDAPRIGMALNIRPVQIFDDDDQGRARGGRGGARGMRGVPRNTAVEFHIYETKSQL